MAITKSDIKLMAPQVLDDTEDGGGQMTGTEIVDGSVNNLFPDMSHLDKMTGRVSMRKAFPAILTDNNDVYYGMHMVLTDPPDDPDVTVCMMTTDDDMDRRVNARNRLESYVAAGPVWAGYLFGTQYEGSKTVTILQREEAALPEVGEVLLLKQTEAPNNEQYIRVVDVTHEVRQFTTGSGGSYHNFTRRQVTLEISDALRYTFDGSAATPVDNPSAPAAVYGTVVVDAAKYYGAAKLAADVSAGNPTVQVDSIFTHLVPSAQSETPVTDLTAGGESAPVKDSGAEYSLTTSFHVITGAVLYIGAGIARNGLTITGAGYTWTDDGNGNLVRGTLVEGTVFYGSGEVHFNDTPVDITTTLTITVTPGAAPRYVSTSASMPVTVNNRGSVWVTPPLRPIPAPGTLTVDYMAQGKWYRLRDNGTGNLVGSETAYGSGTINYATGTATITTGAIPDVDTEILLAWSGPLEIRSQSGALSDAYVEMTAGHTGLARNTITIAWTDGSARQLTDDGNGALTGYGSGTVNYATGNIMFTPTALPPPGTEYTLTYNYGPPETDTIPAPNREGDGTIIITLTNTPLLAGTVSLQYDIDIPEGDGKDLQHPQHAQASRTQLLRDDGAGHLIGVAGSTVDYTTGEIQFDPDKVVSVPVKQYGWVDASSYIS